MTAQSTPNMTVKSVLSESQATLSAVSESPALDAELLLAFCLNKKRSFLYTWPEHELSKEEKQKFDELIDKRLNDYPVAYLLGTQSFWTLDLIVTPNVLIPRPETELLVETALDNIKNIESPKILDLGTGSGAIAIALASERPDAEIFACDYSSKALDVAKKNAENCLANSQDSSRSKSSSISNPNLKSKNVTFIQSDWFANIIEKDFDLIVSNPPYIAPNDPHLIQSIRHEPQQALVAENAGMKDIETIIKDSKDYLKKGCWLMIEHGYDQKEKTLELYNQCGYDDATNLKDIGKNPRVSLAKLPN